MLPDLMVHNSYYFTFSHIYYYCEEEKKVSFHLLSSEIKNSCKWPDAGNGLENTMNKNIKKATKKFTKKLVKAEKKHPNLTAVAVYITAGTFAFRVVSTIVGGVVAVKTIKEVRDGVNEVIDDLVNEDEDVVDVKVEEN